MEHVTLDLKHVAIYNGDINGGGARFDPALEGKGRLDYGGWGWVALFFPYEPNMEQVRMPALVGPFFWPSPFWPLDGFFLLNLGSMAPNYSTRPLMRSSKAPPNQKNRGQFLPQPTPTHRSWHPNLLRVRLVGEE